MHRQAATGSLAPVPYRRGPATAIPPERLVVGDETGTHTRMTPRYARSTTRVAALTPAGLDAPMGLEGAMDREAFVAWLRQLLVPTLMPGQVVVMDNLHVHTGAEVRQIIDAHHCALVYLPAYVPEYTPIEGAYRKGKARGGGRGSGRKGRGRRRMGRQWGW